MMKNILTYMILGISVVGAGSWRIASVKPIAQAQWLTGTWEQYTPKGWLYESWTRLNDHELSGRSYMLKGQDTIVFEQIRLVQEGDTLFYIPAVRDQNGGKPVRFRQTEVSESRLVFGNEAHDFPQQISYTKLGPDSLLAEIAGTRNGKLRKQSFPMRRRR